MGCGMSRLGHREGEVQAKLVMSTVLSRKMKMMRRRVGPSLSKKQLLNDNGSTTERKSSPQRDDDDDSSSPSAKGEEVFFDVQAEEEQLLTDEAMAKRKGKLAAFEETDDIDEQEEDDEDEWPQASIACPGSPSFRVYCIDYRSLEDKYVDDYSGKDDSDTNEGSVGEIFVDAVDDINVEAKKLTTTTTHDQEYTEDDHKATKKRGSGLRKGLKFRSVIPKRKPGKKLINLNVKSCIHPSTSSSKRA